MLATLTDAMVLWTLGVIKAPRREGGGCPMGKSCTCTTAGCIVGSERRCGQAEMRDPLCASISRRIMERGGGGALQNECAWGRTRERGVGIMNNLEKEVKSWRP